MTSTMTRTKRGKRSWRARGDHGLGTIRGLYTLGIFALAGAIGATFAPWMTAPEEDTAQIDARWGQLEAIAAPQLPAGDTALLVDAIATFEGSALADVSPEPGDELDPPAHRAIEELVEWSRGGGGVGAGICADPNLRSFDVIPLARAALHGARSPDDPSFTAIIELGLMLRDRGSLVKALVGQSLLHRALTKVDEEGWELPDVLYRERPTEAHIRSILARYFVCTETYTDEGLRSGMVEPAHLAEGDLEKAVATVVFDRERELSFFRAAFGERVLRALETDHPAVAMQLFTPPREEEVMSLLVREYSAHLGALKQPRQAFARYNDLLLKVADPYRDESIP